ncbi:hypothetical protein AMR72_13075 [Flavobacterium psychrophilum]|nr:hypothetical protein AMR72_13075 [Flavobacterium psychrophilum]AOE53369.1 hypothetical protein ALW18_13065 [Flavobacterium psychrophilum]
MIHRHILYLISGILLLCVSCNDSASKHNAVNNRIDSLIVKAENVSLTEKQREEYTDTISSEIANRQNDSLTRFYFRKTAVSYYNLNLYDKTLEVSRKIYKLAKKDKDTLSMAKGMYFLGTSYYGKSEADSALYYYTALEDLYQQYSNTDPRDFGEAILYKAYIYHDAGEYVLCEAEAFKALKKLLIGNSPTDIYNCYNLIALSLDGQNNGNAAVRYYKMGLDVLKDYKKEGYSDTDIDFFKASSYNNLGSVYTKMERYNEAVLTYQRALKFPVTKESPLLYAKLINNLAYSKFKSGKPEGLPGLFYESLAIRDSLNNEQGIVASNVSLGEYYLHEKDTAQALMYLETAYDKAKTIKSNYDILNSLKMLSNIDKVNNDYYIRRYIKVSDSLQQIAQNTRNKFARIEYDTDRIINEKEALAKKNNFILGVSVIVVLFIAAIFAIYYLNSRNKELLLIQEQQKANEEIYELMFEQQGKIETAKTEEKSRIAMELHDGILNNIYAVRLNLEFINKKSDDESILKRKEFIKELQNVEAEIRGVSHDLSRNALFNQEQSFENILAFMITSQKNNFNTEFEAEISRDIEWESTSNVCKVNVYRIIQEALQNINKYSQAAYAKVSICREDENVKISIVDNGVGFDPEMAKGGIGIKNLRKRAEALNGTLQITSAPGDGTVVDVTFPFQY